MNTPVFKPAWWCRGPHCQTLWQALLRRRPRPALRRERLELPDGDFLDLDWGTDPSVADSQAGGRAPIVLILHGLEGSAQSVYARGLLSALQTRGWRGAVLHFRGCSGTPNRLARSYHSGETGDLDFVVRLLHARHPQAPLAAVGFSLGGNVLLKWLGEQGANAPLRSAVAVSVPFLLDCAAVRLTQGLSRLYQWKLLRSLRRGLRQKFAPPRTPAAPTLAAPIDLHALNRLRCFRDFDHHVTARLHGFESAEHYYRVSSSRQYLPGIAIPTLILHAADDPFMTADAIPRADEVSPTTALEVQAHGGHVGFIGGRWPWAPVYWLERRIPEYLATVLDVATCAPASRAADAGQ